ncbi:hypothetical protein ACJQ40_001954 [Enterococcus faecium]|nr:hypothetical protein [Enterococcus faecium]
MPEKKLSKLERCLQIDIVDFARANGLAVYNKGRDYRLEDHNSFVFDRKTQRFHWNSQDIHGNIIDLTKLFFLDPTIKEPKQQFIAAMDFILKEESKIERVENIHIETEAYQDHPVDYQPLTEQGRNYLKEQRKLPEQLIRYLENEGLVMELKPKQQRENYLVRDDRLDHAVAFLWKDPQTKETVGASYQGTAVDHERFGDRGTYKHIDRNSTTNHGFNVKIGNPVHLKFFESCIDLASYAALHRETLKDTWLVSMEGLKHNVVNHYFHEAVSELAKQNRYPKSIELCVDNDAAGHLFFDKERRMGSIDPFTGEKVGCEQQIANDWQVPKTFKPIYERTGKALGVAPEAIMAIHKTENNLQETNRLITTGDMQGIFGKKLSPKEPIVPIDVEAACMEAARQLKACERKDGSYDFDQFYKDKGDANTQVLFSVKAEGYFNGYLKHDHEFVSEVKKDWNDQLKHEVQQQAIRKQNRAALLRQFQQERK